MNKTTILFNPLWNVRSILVASGALFHIIMSLAPINKRLKSNLKKSHKYFHTLWACTFRPVYVCVQCVCVSASVASPAWCTFDHHSFLLCLCFCVCLCCMGGSVRVLVSRFSDFLGTEVPPISTRICPLPPAVGYPCRCRVTKGSAPSDADLAAVTYGALCYWAPEWPKPVP